MKRKRLGTLLLALALLLGVSAPALPAVGLATAAAAIPAHDQYFGGQLHSDGNAKAAAAFYDAMVTMYEDGTLLTGKDQPVDLDSAEARDLGNAVSTARDAFYMDYPDLFYVNFNNFAVKQDGGGVYITPGTRGQGYLLTGLEAAWVGDMVKSYDAVLASIVNEARVAAPQSGESAQAAQVRTVHDALTRRITYKLDDACSAANLPFIRTAYGLVTGEGVCEAYSRAFKSAMDELGIPCILVEGAFRHSAEVVENHMWALVQLGELWYGVDVTMDDPDDPAGTSDIYTDYLLAGSGIMDKQHAPSTVMSAAGYPFKYHSLVLDSYYTSTVHNSNGLTVRLDANGVIGDMAGEGGGGSGVFYVSYNQKSSTRAAEEDKRYIVARYLVTNEDGDWVTTDWCYLNIAAFPQLEKLETATETVLPMPHVRFVEFGVTDIPPTPLPEHHTAEDITRSNYYQGDPALLLATSGMQENANGTYQAPPYIKSASPSQTNTLSIGPTYDVTLQFDEPLILDPKREDAAIGCDLQVYTYIRGKHQEEHVDKAQVMSTPVLSADGSTVTFTFTPGKDWALDSVFYTFQLTGVVGKDSRKAPNSLTYRTAYPCSAYAYQSQGYDWNVYGKPQLLDDPSDINITDIKDWTQDQVEALSALLKDRMTLVVTTPSQDMTNAMEEKLVGGNAVPEKAAFETYSINLTLCKAQVIKTGQAVRVMLGFPTGYDYEKAKNATFKAYHYSKDAQGNITGVNPIECIVTERGLLILCNSFSPFAVVAADGTTSHTAAEKTLVVSCGEGGSVEVSGGSAGGAKDIYTFADWTGEAAVTAQEGYTIESVTLGDTSISVTNESTVTVPLDGIKGETEMLAVTFAPNEAHWKAEADKVQKNFAEPAAAVITADLPERLAVAAGQSAELKAAYTSTAGSLLQWYKDGEALPGETGAALTVKSSGSYQARVTTFAGPRSTETRSKVCAVTVAPAAAPAPAQAPAAATPAPTVTPAPAAPTAAPAQAAAAPTPTAVPTAVPGPGKGGPEPTPAPTPKPAAPAAALTNTPEPTVPPAAEADTAPQATAAPAAQTEKSGIPPLAAAGIAVAGLAVAGGLVWMFLPRRKHYK